MEQTEMVIVSKYPVRLAFQEFLQKNSSAIPMLAPP